jgi:hypothetical protein
LAQALLPLCEWGSAHSAAMEAIRLRRTAAASAEPEERAAR